MESWYNLGTFVFLYVLQTVSGQMNGYNAYNRLNPITYYGFTQPYLSGFYGGIGGMPYMSSWQASMYDGSNSQVALNMMGLMGGMGMGMGFGGSAGGFGSWNSSPLFSHNLPLMVLSLIFCLRIIQKF